MLLNFRKFADSGEAYLKDLAGRLGTPNDRDRAARILRNVLHLLRDQITPQESVQLIAQLPMFMKAVYVDGWKIGGKQDKIRHFETFVDEIRYPPAVKIYTDFKSKEEAEAAIRTVFAMIVEQVSVGEIKDVVGTMPPALRPLFEPSVITK